MGNYYSREAADESAVVHQREAETQRRVQASLAADNAIAAGARRASTRGRRPTVAWQ